MDEVVKNNFIKVKYQESLIFVKDFVEMLSTYSHLPN